MKHKITKMIDTANDFFNKYNGIMYCIELFILIISVLYQ